MHKKVRRVLSSLPVPEVLENTYRKATYVGSRRCIYIRKNVSVRKLFRCPGISKCQFTRLLSNAHYSPVIPAAPGKMEKFI